MAKFHSLKVSEVKKETRDAVSVTFDVPEKLASEYKFIHGQNLTLKAQINGEDVRRSYSICTSPSEEKLTVTIKKQDFGKFSTFANEKLKAGDTLDVMTPTGHFYTKLSPSNKKNYVAFAAGSGITPIMSIIKTVLETEPESSITLIYGNRGFKSIIFRDELADLKNKYMDRFAVYHILSRESQEIKLFNGKITKEKCESICNALIDIEATDDIFICGPEAMIHNVKAGLSGMGVDEKKIHFELFTSPDAKLWPEQKKIERKDFDAKKESKVSIILDGIKTEFIMPYGGDNILNKALEKGADLPFACKGGVCATCRAKIVEGEVEMDVNYALVDEEVEQGFVLTCQSHPRTEVVVVDFDSR